MAPPITTKLSFALGLSLMAPLALIACGPSGGGKGAVTPATVAAAKKEFPQATAESLDHGRQIFEAKCNACHALPAPSSEPASEWRTIMVRMGKQAALSQADTDLVLQWVIAKGSEGG